MHILSSVIPGQPGQVKECETIFLWPVTAISGQAYGEGSDMSAIKVFCQSYSVVCLSVWLPACPSVCQASSICPSFCLFLCLASCLQFTLWPIPSMRCASRESCAHTHEQCAVLEIIRSLLFEIWREWRRGVVKNTEIDFREVESSSQRIIHGRGTQKFPAKHHKSFNFMA